MHNVQSPTVKSRKNAIAVAIKSVVISGGLGLVALPVTSFAATTVQIENQQAILTTFNIKANSLDVVLKEFAQRTGINISYPAELVSKINNEGLTGHYSVEAGLKTILIKTEFTAVKTTSGYTLTKNKNSSNIKNLALTTVVNSEAKGINQKDSTATKMHISLKDTGRSVVKVSKQEVSDMAATDIRDIAAYQAGFNWAYSDDRLVHNRGIQTNISKFMVNGLRSLNGFYVGSGSSIPNSYNLESVTFLSGTDSILYGSGIAGGAINVTTKSPQEESKTTLGVSTRSYLADDIGYFSRNLFTLDLDSTGKLVGDDVLYRVITRVTPNGKSHKDNHSDDDKFIDLSLTFNVGDNTKITPRFEYKNQEKQGGTGWTDGIFGSNFINGTLGITTGDAGTFADRSFNYGSPLDVSKSKSTTAELHIEHILGNGWLLDARGAVVHTKGQGQSLYISDSSALGNTIGNTTLERKWVYALTDDTYNLFDVKTEGKFTTGNLEHHLLAGVNYRYKEEQSARSFQSSGDAVGLYTVNVANPSNQLYSAMPDSVKDKINLVPTVDRDINFYLKDRITFDRLTIALSLGYLDFHGEESDGKYQQDFTHFAYDAGAIYKLNEDVNLFASYSQSYDPVDTSNISRFGQDGVNYEPEESDNYEIGAKGEFFNQKLNASMALFYLNTKNDTYRETVNEVTTMYQTLGEKFRSHGVQVNALYHFTDQLSTNVNYTYTDAHDTKGKNVGIQAEMTPYNALTIWNSYSMDSQPIRFSLGMRYESSKTKQSSALGNYDSYIPSYTEFDFGTYYETNKWGLSLVVKNVLDKNRAAVVANWAAVSTSAPRSLNLNLQYHL